MRKIFVSLTVFVLAFLTLVSTNVKKAQATGGKVIDVSISDQMMTVIENYRVIKKFPVSTGTWALPTPLGTHQIYNHIPDAYSTPYDLYMPHWMAITPDGGYGIHGLPYWKYSWGNVYEGENHLGVRVSHGCIRLSLDNATWLYDWAPNGTTVLVHDDSGVQATVIPPDYTASILDQSPSEITLRPGESTKVWVRLKNTGKNWWYNVGPNPIDLGTFNPIDRPSPFYDPSWLASNRPARLPISGINNDNGETTFEFTLTAPKQLGDYEEHFKPVAENYSWFEEPDIVWKIKVYEPEYSCAWVGQSIYPVISPGAITELKISFRNTGWQTWYNSGAVPMHLGTSEPLDRNSIFADASWPAPNRPAALDQAVVKPGEIGTFTFNIKAPMTPGLYTEHFRLVAENKTWLEDHGVFWRIGVQ
jgi:hypothetical protein